MLWCSRRKAPLEKGILKRHSCSWYTSSRQGWASQCCARQPSWSDFPPQSDDRARQTSPGARGRKYNQTTYTFPKNLTLWRRNFGTNSSGIKCIKSCTAWRFPALRLNTSTIVHNSVSKIPWMLDQQIIFLWLKIAGNLNINSNIFNVKNIKYFQHVNAHDYCN